MARLKTVLKYLNLAAAYTVFGICLFIMAYIYVGIGLEHDPYTYIRMIQIDKKYPEPSDMEKRVCSDVFSTWHSMAVRLYPKKRLSDLMPEDIIFISWGTEWELNKSISFLLKDGGRHEILCKYAIGKYGLRLGAINRLGMDYDYF